MKAGTISALLQRFMEMALVEGGGLAALKVYALAD
jgi:hypothetical protein